MAANDVHPPNPQSPIDCTDDGSVTEARRSQLRKHSSPIDFKPSSIVTVVSSQQYENALGPIEAQPTPIVTLVSASHSVNAYLPIERQPDPIITFVSALHVQNANLTTSQPSGSATFIRADPWKAYSSISLTPLRNLTSVIEVQRLKQPSLIVEQPAGIVTFTSELHP
jgi:hypothetical protein